MSAPAFTTWMELVNLALQSVGHPVTTDLAGSSDEAVLRMGYYANSACNELMYSYDWEHLNKEGSISIVSDFSGQEEKGFDLPSDFADFVDDTQWDSSTQLPAIGPVSPQDWQWLVVREAMITTRFLWRIREGQMWVKSPPDVATPFTFEYMSALWARDASDTPKGLMTLNDDYHTFPYALPVLLTRAKWLEQEGYDSKAAKAEFQKAFDYFTGGNKGATALSLVPGVGYPYLDTMRNLPPTGYGT